MTEMDPWTLVWAVDCRRCGEELSLVVEVGAETVTTVLLGEHRQNVLYKLTGDVRPEVHLCAGEWDEPLVPAFDAVRQYWETGPGSVKLAHTQSPPAPPPARKRILVVAPTMYAANQIVADQEGALKDWAIDTFSVWGGDPGWLRGKQYHLAVVQRGSQLSNELNLNIELAMRLGDTPTVGYLDPGATIPERWLK